MGKKRIPDEEPDPKDSIEDNKEILEKLHTESKFDIKKIFDVINLVSGGDPSEGGPRHIPINALAEIKSKLAATKKETNENGDEILTPLYTEEEKVKVIFALLSERGLNLLDYLEKVIEEGGYSTEVVLAINNTMEKTSDVLRDISEMQYRKAKLENERINLEIQKYKADLKKREIEIKERKVEMGGPSTQVIAVGNPAELLEIMKGKKGIESITTVETVGVVKEYKEDDDRVEEDEDA